MIPPSSKRVRIQNEPQYPPTPSSSSSSAATGPLAPQTYYHSHIVPLPLLTPGGYHYADLPETQPASSPVYGTGQTRVDLRLALPPRGHHPSLRWDLMQDPQRLGLMNDFLDQPATIPPVSKLTIRITRPTYPWSIAIAARPSSSRAPRSVTIRDVLYYIYDNLRKPITPAEWRATINKDAVTAAFNTRTGYFADERQRGVRRVDYLLDKHMFYGLSVVRTDREGVVLELSLARRA